jgi:hypothetical protein
MSLDRAREYRIEARKCFEQAERAPTEMLRARMREIAEEWLKMAANAEAEFGRAPRRD